MPSVSREEEPPRAVRSCGGPASTPPRAALSRVRTTPPKSESSVGSSANALKSTSETSSGGVDLPRDATPVGLKALTGARSGACPGACPCSALELFGSERPFSVEFWGQRPPFWDVFGTLDLGAKIFCPNLAG